MRCDWRVVIDNDRDDTTGPFTAYVPKDWGDPRDTPWKATGETPVLAMAALAEVLKRWPADGADRWMSRPQGQQFVDHFTAGEPLPGPPEVGKA